VKRSVDQKVYALAEYFLQSVPGYTTDDIWELASVLQTACEDACREVADRPKAES